MKTFAIGSALALMVLAAPSASAQRAVNVSLSGVSDQQVVQNVVPLKAEGSSAAGIRRLTMWIDGDVVAEVTPNNLRQQAEATFDWDTTRYVSSDQLARNRAYDVRVKAVSNSGAEDEATTHVIVDNVPTTPLGLTADVTDNEISLQWAANPEPDIIGYRVERFYGDEYVPVTDVEATSHSEARDPGKYSYRVVALRHSEVIAAGLESEPSTSVTAAVAKSAGTRLEQTTGGTKGRSSRRGSASGKAVRIGAGGLPSGAALPNLPRLSGLPDAPAAAPWGSYEKRLPYKLPKGGVPLQAAPAGSVQTSWTVVPPDGLRWVALGLLLMVLAAASRFIAWRLKPDAKPG